LFTFAKIILTLVKKFFVHIIIFVFVTCLFTPPVFGIIMINEDIEKYTDVNINNFFEEEIKSHDLDLFTKHYNINNAALVLELKKTKFNSHIPTNYVPNSLDYFSPPPEFI